MIIMSVDYGDARTGVAICDKKEILATPICVIEEKYRPNLIKKILEIVKDKKPDMIVVGYPKNMDGSCGERCQKCSELADEIRLLTEIDVNLWDERLSTVSAYRALNEADCHGRKTRKIIDAVAATTILQDYLNYRKSKM